MRVTLKNPDRESDYAGTMHAETEDISGALDAAWHFMRWGGHTNVTVTGEDGELIARLSCELVD